MKETKIFNNKTERVPVANSQLYQQPTKIQGILTSNLRTRTSTDVPYMAFFRANYTDAYLHSLSDCRDSKCKSCEIPVVFRIENEYPGLLEISLVVDKNDSPLGKWHKPNLSKGDSVILEGEFSNSKDSNRPSFTCYSYEIINSHE